MNICVTFSQARTAWEIRYPCVTRLEDMGAIADIPPRTREHRDAERAVLPASPPRVEAMQPVSYVAPMSYRVHVPHMYCIDLHVPVLYMYASTVDLLVVDPVCRPILSGID